MVKKCRVNFDHWTVCQLGYYYWHSVVCCLSVLAVQRYRNSEFRNNIGLEFRLTVYFWHGLNRVCRALRNFSSISPLSEIWAANLVRSPLHSRSPTPPLLAPLPLHRFLARPLTAPLPLTQFSARSAPFSAPIPIRSHALPHTMPHWPRSVALSLVPRLYWTFTALCHCGTVWRFSTVSKRFSWYHTLWITTCTNEVRTDYVFITVCLCVDAYKTDQAEIPPYLWHETKVR